MSLLHVAVIGLSMGEYHLVSVLQSGAEVTAICDTNPDTLQRVGDKHGIPAGRRFTDYRLLIDSPEIDAVLIVVPDQLHRTMCEEFLSAGKHVMCEKPLALTHADVSAIVSAANACDRVFMVGQICRFTPAFKKAKELIDAGTIGELYFVESEYAHDYAKIMDGSWRCDPIRHGVVGGGCHAVDLLRFITDSDPVEVFAYGTHKLLPMVPYDDATISVLKFPNGIIGKVFVSTGCKRPYSMRTLFYGTRGTIICDNTSPTMELYTIGADGVLVDEKPEVIAIDVNNHNTDGEFAVFHRCITEGTKPEMDVYQGAKTVSACLAIMESARTGLPVAPNYEF